MSRLTEPTSVGFRDVDSRVVGDSQLWRRRAVAVVSGFQFDLQVAPGPWPLTPDQPSMAARARWARELSG